MLIESIVADRGRLMNIHEIVSVTDCKILIMQNCFSSIFLVTDYL